MANSITADEIREQFSQAMSAMYQQEVPQYGTLLGLHKSLLLFGGCLPLWGCTR